ncbi:MAG TPA: ChaN family lipoprotein [Gemmatimonadales bacterium]|nr:ChaN family lipoprotein [Gemmatimonadales bacterium]
MRPPVRLAPLVFLAACASPGGGSGRAAPLILPENVSAHDAATAARLSPADLRQRLDRADLVLLGELHDNPVHHQVRGTLIRSAARRPAVVFEQFAATTTPIPVLAAGEPMEAWLDRHGFDRTGWRWPLHRPVVEAALANGRSIWGSNMSREALRSVVREGAAGAPPDLRRLMEQTPLDDAARAALDRDLIDGHCGQLPEAMIPGMRAAQEVRDAAMTRALVAAGVDGPAWLIAGNGHVRTDIAVPRMLPDAAPGRAVVVVGLLERGQDGSMPDRAEQQRYDIVLITPRAAREDPCASFRRQASGTPGA